MSATDLFVKLAETSLAVAALIVLVLLIRRPFAKMFGAHAAYALWLAPVLRLALPDLNILPALDAPVYTALPVLLEGAVIADQPAFGLASLAAAAGLFLWVAIGVAWFSLRISEAGKIKRKAITQSRPASGDLIIETSTMASLIGLKNPPQIRVLDADQGPVVMGLINPVIFVPTTFASTYTPRERKLALAHECAHIKRGDLWTSLAANAIEAAQWPNPAVHFAVRAFRADQEAACDAHVLRHFSGGGASADYASAIMKSVRQAGAPAPHALSLGHPIKERLKMIKNQNASPVRRVVGGVCALALIGSGLAATASYGYAADDDKAKEIKKEIYVKRIDMGDDSAKGQQMILVSRNGKLESQANAVIVGANSMLHTVSGQMDLHCAENGEGEEPVIIEFKDEDGAPADTTSFHTVICLSGEDAKPENRAKRLREAIDRLEKDGEAEQKRREKMIKEMRRQARELEKQGKK